MLNYYAKPAFTSWKRDVLNKDNEIVNRNDTMLYRGDLDWNSFVKFSNKKYRDVDKVNVYDYACSDGSEAYTFLISMFNNIPIKDTKKFLPVLAYDIDNNAIKKAKSGELSISEEEKLRFAINSNYDLETFFDKNRYFNLYFPKTILSKNVEFDKYDEFLMTENRYASLKAMDEDISKEILNTQKEWAIRRYNYYKKQEDQE